MPSSTSSMLQLALVLAAGQLAAAESYTLQKSYTADNFFQDFHFITGADPTHGFVDYVDYDTAQKDGLATVSDGVVHLGVDSKTTLDPANGPGRASVRLESKELYTRMVLVADIAHMPEGCGTWPALWTYGNEWPSNGEIDILEGVNSQAANQVTLHTSPGCSMRQGKQLASTRMAVKDGAAGDCGAGNGNDGCAQTTVSGNNYGRGFNAAGGGFYVMEWADDGVTTWFAVRNSSVANALSGDTDSVDTSALGMPLAQFSAGEGCDMTSHFQQHQITVDTTFCGDWAGSDEVWKSDTECSALANNCKEYVANNPNAFTNAYWRFNSLRVYSQGGASPTNGTNSTTATPSVRRRVEKYRLRK